MIMRITLKVILKMFGCRQITLLVKLNCWYLIFGRAWAWKGLNMRSKLQFLQRRKKKTLADKFIMIPKAKFLIINYKAKTWKSSLSLI